VTKYRGRNWRTPSELTCPPVDLSYRGRNVYSYTERTVLMATSRAVILISLAKPAAIKLALLEQVIVSAPRTMPVVILFDGTEEEYIRAAHHCNTGKAVTVHAPRYQYSKVHRLVISIECPENSMAAQWCAASGYDFCWHMEDDVYVRNMSALDLAYRNSTADLLTHEMRTTHPFWVRPPLRGETSGRGFADRKRLLLDAPLDTPRFFALAMYLMSSAFAQSLVRTSVRREHYLCARYGIPIGSTSTPISP
jgi:hypothetical protein